MCTTLLFTWKSKSTSCSKALSKSLLVGPTVWNGRSLHFGKRCANDSGEGHRTACLECSSPGSTDLGLGSSCPWGFVGKVLTLSGQLVTQRKVKGLGYVMSKAHRSPIIKVGREHLNHLPCHEAMRVFNAKALSCPFLDFFSLPVPPRQAL